MNKAFLILDRNKRFLLFIEEIILKKYPDSKVYISDSIDSALTILKFNEINALICEDQLEDILRFSQFSTFKKISPGIQIIATTSYQTPEFKAGAICNGAVESVVKPIPVGIFNRLLDYTFDVIDLLSKKSLLLQDILMLTNEGQVFSMSTVKSLITSLENRFPLLKSQTTYSWAVLKSFTELFNLPMNDKIILELSLAFFGITFDYKRIITAADFPDLRNHKTGTLIIPDTLRNSLIIIQDSFNWQKDEPKYEASDSSLHLLSDILAVIIAFISLTRNNGFSKPINEEEALSILKKFSGTRFDSTIIAALGALKHPITDGMVKD
jgi:hypothetical protein